tara:strand:- start:200 stop:799 length:600 start_codon:yes stop_codon:yes gene_type:complete
MEKQTVFSNFIAHEYLPNIDNVSIAEYAYDLEAKGESVRVSNEGGFHSTHLDLANSKTSDLFRELIRCVSETFISLGFNIEEYEPVIHVAWLNINRKHNFMRHHNHNKSLLSGVYYIKTPKNSGDLEFNSPVADHKYVVDSDCIKDFNDFNSNTWIVPAEESKLVLFPSWLVHFVQPNFSDEDRISLSFDCSVRKRNLT